MILYTSYKTSVALREAGAPQEPGGRVWYWSDTYRAAKLVDEFICSPDNPLRPSRAWRADEIIEEVTAIRGITTTTMCSAPWTVTVCGDDPSRDRDYTGDSLVEALAAAWLAVMREEKP